MITTRSFAMSVLTLALGAAVGCGYYYQTHKQTTYVPNAVQSAQVIRVKPISFALVPKPSDYEKQADWEKDIDGWKKMWAEEIANKAKENGLAGRVVMLQDGETLSNGLYVETKVTKIRREYSFMTGGFDFLTTDIRFINAADNKVVFHAIVESTSKKYGPGGYRNMSFHGRVGTASWNMVPPLLSIIKTGGISPTMD